MYCLFLDTSCSDAVFALFEDGNVIEEVCLDVKSARHPCAIWQSLLDRHQLSLQEIELLACGVGPGSYTGIRTAAATAKGVSLSTNKPIVAVSSLLTLVPEEGGSYLIMIDGGISGAYTQRVVVSETGVEADAPQVAAPEELEEVLSRDVALVTDSLLWIEKRGISDVGFRVERRHSSIVARYVLREASAGRMYTAHSLPLWYLRKTQAEIDHS